MSPSPLGLDSITALVTTFPIPMTDKLVRKSLGVGLAVGASVAVSGVDGFVCLIVPHFIRAIYGEQPSQILLPSALGGAILTLAADSLVRLVPGPSEVRLGIAMAVLGAPFFLLLLLRYRKGAA